MSDFVTSELLAPADRPHNEVIDERTAFSANTAATGPDDAFKRAFVQSKLRLAYTSFAPNIAARDAAVSNVSAALAIDSNKAFRELTSTGEETTGPVPGGVGYGVFYSPTFKTTWGNGTSLTCDFACPTPPGGNINTFLYLTATNRSGLGVEAFVSYNGQNDTHFRVFDWARNDHWQTDRPFAQLSSYLTQESAHGQTYQVLPVWNTTMMLNATTWRNQVLLYNHPRGGWDLVYQFDYAATGVQQKSGWVGSWGPIVETFQPLYSKTNPMGALRAQITAADSNGKWQTWSQIGPSDSSIRVDNQGFQSVFLDPNYDFIVKS